MVANGNFPNDWVELETAASLPAVTARLEKIKSA
jgi:hypothetical protein